MLRYIVINLGDRVLRRVSNSGDRRYGAVVWSCWRVVRTSLQGWPARDTEAEIDLLIESIKHFKRVEGNAP